MSSNGDQKKGFEPLHKGHAIEQVIISVVMDSEIPEGTLTEIKQTIGTPEELPAYAELAAVSFAVGPGLPASAALAPSTTGHLFRKVRPDGITENELKAHRNTLSFRTTLYTRWNVLWSLAKTYIEKLLPYYARHGRVAQLSLNYIDKFIWYGAKDQYDITQVLRRDSPYLAGHIFETKDLWHIHTGRFMLADDATKRLINVNSDYLDERRQGETRRTISIRTALIDSFNQAGFNEFNLVNQQLIDSVDKHFQELHELDKVILKSILTADTARRIALS